MAQSKEVKFVTQPSQDFICPVCLSILQEPFLTTCCGGHFCEACIQKVKKQLKECPLCKKSPLKAVIDKYFKRQVEQLMVYCPQKECKWTGEFGKVSKHLATDQLAGDCQYVTVKCPLSCGQEILRKLLDSHITNDCPYRSASCKYCDFKGSHLVVTTQHKDICLNYPCTCPNSCSLGVIKRHKMSDHLAQCPEQEIPCSFLAIGCAKVMRRKQLKEHLKMSIVEHQMLTCKASLTMELTQHRMQAMQQQHRLEIAAIRDELARMESKAGQAEYWVNGFKLMAEEVKKNSWTVYLSRINELVSSMSPAVAPVIVGLPNIAVSDHVKCSHSAPFYTHSRGYKMLLYAKAFYDHKNLLQMSFISIQNQANIMVSLCIAKGEYDDHLKWPLQGKATILLLNSQQDDKHREAVCNFTATRYTDDHQPVQSKAHKLTHKCYKKQMRHNPYKYGGNKAIFYSAGSCSEVGPSHDPYHQQCKPVESVESVEFSYDNNDAASYFKEDHLYFKVTIETNSTST